MKHGVFSTLPNPSNSYCNGAIRIPPEQKVQNFNLSENIMASVFWDRKGILLVDFMPLGATINAAAYCDNLTRLRRTIQRNIVRRRVPAPRQPAAQFRASHHCTSGKIEVGYIGPSAVQSELHARRFPLVSSPKETSRWEKVRRRR